LVGLRRSVVAAGGYRKAKLIYRRRTELAAGSAITAAKSWQLAVQSPPHRAGLILAGGYREAGRNRSPTGITQAGHLCWSAAGWSFVLVGGFLIIIINISTVIIIVIEIIISIVIQHHFFGWWFFGGRSEILALQPARWPYSYLMTGFVKIVPVHKPV